MLATVGVVLLLSGQVLAQSTDNGTGSAANAAVPRLIRFSGVVREASGKPIHGVTEISFSLFKEESGGEPLWFETQTVEVDAQGRYNVLLGAMHADGLPMDLFTSGEARWLSIMVGKREQPRVLLVSVPYALKAGDAESLGGRPATAYVATDQLKNEVESTLSSSKFSQQTLNTTLLATGGGTGTPPAIVETSPSTFTCSTSGNCVTVTQNGTGHGLSATAKAGSGIAQGVRGESLSPTGRGVYGVVNQPSGVNYGVRGDSASVQGYGVFGYATSATGLSYGLFGLASSNSGVGLAGRATSPTGPTIGLRAIVDSADGIAGVFENRAGGKILSGRTTGLVEKFSVASNGNVATSGSLTTVGNVITGGSLIASEVLSLPATSNPSVGIIYMGGSRFIHGCCDLESTFVGMNAGNLDITGLHNTAVGASALYSNTTGYENSALGTNALYSNTMGNANIAFGYNALYYNTTGYSNVAVGYATLGRDCVGIIGECAASNNTGIGYYAGDPINGAHANVTGANNTFIGAYTGPGTSTQLSNATAIGANAVVSASNALILGSINGSMVRLRVSTWGLVRRRPVGNWKSTGACV